MAYFKVILKDLGPPLKPFQFNELIMYHTPQLRVASLLMTRLIKTLGPLIIIIILQHHDPESL